MMSARNLECFVKIAETGSFSQAAILLGWSQPALSRHIRDLESDLKVRLLHRNGRGVTLTAAGQRLYARAQEILERIGEARREAQGFTRETLESAVVGMPPTVTRILALPLARALYAVHPDVQLRFIESFSGHLLEWLSDGRMDAAVLYTSEATQRLNAEPLLIERLHVVGPAGRGPLPAEMPFAEVAELPLILPSRPHGLRRQIETYALRHGLALKVRMEADGFFPILQLVAEGLGWTVLPPPSLHAELDRGLLVSALIVEPYVERSLVLATSAKRADNPGIAALIRIIRQEVRARDAEMHWSARPHSGDHGK